MLLIYLNIHSLHSGQKSAIVAAEKPMSPKNQRSCIALILILGYLLLSIWSIFHMSHMSSHGMDMEDCPYLAFQDFPGNSLGSHLSAWQTFALIALPIIFYFSYYLTRYFFKSALTHRITFFRNYDTQSQCRSPIEQLFATGILHPKAP